MECSELQVHLERTYRTWLPNGKRRYRNGSTASLLYDFPLSLKNISTTLLVCLLITKKCRGKFFNIHIDMFFITRYHMFTIKILN